MEALKLMRNVFEAGKLIEKYNKAKKIKSGAGKLNF